MFSYFASHQNCSVLWLDPIKKWKLNGSGLLKAKTMHWKHFNWIKPSAKFECYCYIVRYIRFLQCFNCKKYWVVMSNLVLALHKIYYKFVATKLNSSRFTTYFMHLLDTQVYIITIVQQSKKYFLYVLIISRSA